METVSSSHCYISMLIAKLTSSPFPEPTSLSPEPTSPFPEPTSLFPEPTSPFPEPTSPIHGHTSLIHGHTHPIAPGSAPDPGYPRFSQAPSNADITNAD